MAAVPTLADDTRILTAPRMGDRLGLGSTAGIREYARAYGRRGAITDDTQMTLWTAEGLIRADDCFTQRGICHMARIV